MSVLEFHSEAPETGNAFRESMLAEVQELVRMRQRESDRRRKQFFKPDFTSPSAYEQSLIRYREELKALLGWPLTDACPGEAPSAEFHPVAEDSLGEIFRVTIETLPGVHTYGLYFRPPGKGPFPLVLSQHGGQGTPELCSGFFGSANYNDMTRRILGRGAAVFAPQLMLWDPERFGPDPKKMSLIAA
jgi:hypothetical protein